MEEISYAHFSQGASSRCGGGEALLGHQISQHFRRVPFSSSPKQGSVQYVVLTLMNLQTKSLKAIITTLKLSETELKRNQSDHWRNEDPQRIVAPEINATPNDAGVEYEREDGQATGLAYNLSGDGTRTRRP